MNTDLHADFTIRMIQHGTRNNYLDICISAEINEISVKVCICQMDIIILK